MKRKGRILFGIQEVFMLALCAVLTLAGFVLSQGAMHVQASGGSLSGYAWSSNIGWISFSGITQDSHSYGVLINSDNTTLSGYAWGDNIGWINFGPNSCGATPTITNGALAGWAQTVSDSNCISLSSGTSPIYGPTIAGGKNQSGAFDGYIWGSDVVGWISFNCDTGGTGGTNVCATSNYNVQAAFPGNIGTQGSGTMTLTPSPSHTRNGETTSVTFTWTEVGSNLAGPCSITSSPAVAGFPLTNLSTGALNGSIGPFSVNLTQTTLFNISCPLSGGGTAVGSGSVSLVPIFKEPSI